MFSLFPVLYSSLKVCRTFLLTFLISVMVGSVLGGTDQVNTHMWSGHHEGVKLPNLAKRVCVEGIPDKLSKNGSQNWGKKKKKHLNVC